MADGFWGGISFVGGVYRGGEGGFGVVHRNEVYRDIYTGTILGRGFAVAVLSDMGKAMGATISAVSSMTRAVMRGGEAGTGLGELELIVGDRDRLVGETCVTLKGVVCSDEGGNTRVGSTRYRGLLGIVSASGTGVTGTERYCEGVIGDSGSVFCNGPRITPRIGRSSVISVAMTYSGRNSCGSSPFGRRGPIRGRPRTTNRRGTRPRRLAGVYSLGTRLRTGHRRKFSRSTSSSRTSSNRTPRNRLF